MSLHETLSAYRRPIQGQLFPWLEEDLGPLGESHERFLAVPESARVEAFVRQWHGVPGGPRKDRAAPARAFMAKAVFDLP